VTTDNFSYGFASSKAEDAEPVAFRLQARRGRGVDVRLMPNYITRSFPGDAPTIKIQIACNIHPLT